MKNCTDWTLTKFPLQRFMRRRCLSASSRLGHISCAKQQSPPDALRGHLLAWTQQLSNPFSHILKSCQLASACADTLLPENVVF
ncbi:unnamed protein product [Acanthoscelides obtectus]|uniref:Uncharacterized protein n=1 Tax=Acanthoscelides obtectus TaxID=200917 RepID=A0A9P0KDU2_ACAOB|nr:unnamed protein product [Acanthoscelides obtectus]CAK1640990.1 hypothetical protein AOBTE_LOCUS12063 [Acanthoscelides obtectus]